MTRPPPRSTLFPNPTLFRSKARVAPESAAARRHDTMRVDHFTTSRMPAEVLPSIELETAPNPTASIIWLHGLGADGKDRKSTRLNSSHSQISYAVFCLKKKT